jgi:hypothetical protein
MPELSGARRKESLSRTNKYTFEMNRFYQDKILQISWAWIVIYKTSY